MKTKSKIISLFFVLFFLSVFFAGVDSAKADSLYEACVEDCEAGDETCFSRCDYLDTADGNSDQSSTNETIDSSDNCGTGNENLACCDHFGGRWEYPGCSFADNTCDAFGSKSCCENSANAGYWYDNTCNAYEYEDPFEKCANSGGAWDGYSCQAKQSNQTFSECMKEFNRTDICGGLEGNPSDTIEEQGAGSACSSGGACFEGYKCETSSWTCKTDGLLSGTECRNNNDCFRLRGPGYECTGWFADTCEKVETGSTSSAGGTNSVGPVAKTNAPMTIQGKPIPSNSIVMSDGSIQDSAGNTIAPAGSMQVPGVGGAPSGFSMCVSGGCWDEHGDQITGPIPISTYGGGGGFPVSTNGGGGGLPNSPDFVGPPTPAQAASLASCGNGFQKVGGVCFPTTTGLSDAPIYLILSNLFSWLMGLFTTLAVLAFVVSGIQYFMASGDESMAESAKENATHALIGIIVGLSGFIIIKAIAAALSGQSYFF